MMDFERADRADPRDRLCSLRDQLLVVLVLSPHGVACLVQRGFDVLWIGPANAFEPEVLPQVKRLFGDEDEAQCAGHPLRVCESLDGALPFGQARIGLDRAHCGADVNPHGLQCAFEVESCTRYGIPISIEEMPPRGGGSHQAVKLPVGPDHFSDLVSPDPPLDV